MILARVCFSLEFGYNCLAYGEAGVVGSPAFTGSVGLSSLLPRPCGGGTVCGGGTTAAVFLR